MAVSRLSRSACWALLAGHVSDVPPLGYKLRLSGASSRAASGTRVDLGLVTWLILPVVICLSQRLSHACLSISNYTVKLRMAH